MKRAAQAERALRGELQEHPQFIGIEHNGALARGLGGLMEEVYLQGRELPRERGTGDNRYGVEPPRSLGGGLGRGCGIDGPGGAGRYPGGAGLRVFPW